MMRRFALMLAALAAASVFAVSCGKGDKAIRIDGEWELSDVRFSTKSAIIGSETVTVYISFIKDGSFTIYQQLGDGRFRTFTGAWTLAGDVLNGTYSDGKQWACPYTVSRDGNTLVMTTSPDGNDVYTYNKCSIPDSVRNSF